MELVESSAQFFRNRDRGIGSLAAAQPARIGEGIGSVEQLLAILGRRLRTIAATAVCGAALLTLAGLWISPKYTALAQVGVISPAASPTGTAWGDRASQMIVDTHMVMLKSRDFLREVLVSLDEGKAGAPPVQGRELDLRLEEFERQVGISQSLSSSVISIRYTSTDAEQAANAANRIVTLYRTRLKQRETDGLEVELNRLGQRIADIDRAGNVARTQIQTRLVELAKAPPADATVGKEQIGRLEKEARANAQLQVDLLRRQMEVRLRLEAPTQGVWIVSLAAVPVSPSSLPRWLLIVPGVILLVIGSCFWALVSEQFDERLRGAGDVTAALALPCAGLVPSIPRAASRDPCGYLSKQPFTPYAEAIRAIAARLGAAAPCEQGRIVLLGHSEPGEGATTLAIGLAQYAASIGRRVLLVDLDVRTPSVLHRLGLEADLDAVDLVLNEAAPEAVVQRHPVLAFDCLPVRPGRVDPLRLVASERLHAALADFRTTYDLVIVDGPSALRPEAPLLAAAADKVLLVVKWGTRRGVAESAVRALCGADPARHDPADCMAAVVTQVPAEAHAQYPVAASAAVTGIGRWLRRRRAGGGEGGIPKRFRSGGVLAGQEGQ